MDQATELRKKLENVKVTLTKYAKHGNVPVSETNIAPFRTQCIDNTPSLPPDFFWGVGVSGVTDLTMFINDIIKENKEMKDKIIKLQTK